MRSFHKLLSLLLALAIVLGIAAAAPLTAGAAGDPALPYSAWGTCGAENPDDVEWYSFDDGSMVFFGMGAIKDYTSYSGENPSPWYGDDFGTIANTLFINKIAVEYGITRIGDYCFAISENYPYQFYIQLKNIDIANTVTSIGKYAFYNQVIENIIIPPSVTHIGVNAFKKCKLTSFTYYGDPDKLIWDAESGTDTEFPSGLDCHILNTYSQEEVNAFNARFAYKNITFRADAENLFDLAGEDVDRNIAMYYGTANSRIFGGAAPYVIVGRFDGKKKSVTHGSNGFASCVLRDGKYYILTDATKGTLHQANLNSTGKAESYDKEKPLTDIQLIIKHEYIGTNTVKVIYQLKNLSNQEITGLKVGGTGDIKIGADDFASIEPLTETYTDHNNIVHTNKQVGFYMKSNQSFDQSGSNYATLGFIGNRVEKTKTEGENPVITYYDDAHFFYGKADSNATGSAVGAKTVVLVPERIFSMNNTAEANSGRSQSRGEFSGVDNGIKRDSGMSYYWDVDSLPANSTKEYAVLFSVYGASDDESAQTVIKDIRETAYHTVTFNNEDGTTLFKQVVKEGDRPVYGGATPTKARYQDKNYTFSGWSHDETKYGINDPLPTVTGDITYTATYNVGTNRLFIKHSLTLRGDIGVNFFLNVTPEEVAKGVTVKFDWCIEKPKHSEYTLSEDDLDSESGLYKAKCWVAAAEMACDIYATAYFEGNLYTGEDNHYSVRKYGETIIKNEDSQFSPALVNLAIAMLDYGAKAQLVFDRQKNDLANKNFDKFSASSGYSMVPVDPDTVGTAINGTRSNMTQGTGEFGLRYEGSSVILKTKTTLRHFYSVQNSALFTDEIKNNTEGFTYGGVTGNLICFDMTDIPAAELDELKTFKIGGKSYDYSVLNYCKLMLYDDSGVSDEEKDLATALYWYNQKANAYFV